MIRNAKKEDFPDIFRMYFDESSNRFLYYDRMGKKKFKEVWKKMLDRKHSYTFERRGRVVGFISCVRKTGQEEHITHLSPIIVDSEFVRNGIGARLLRHLLRKIDGEGFKRMDLTVNSDNKKAIRLFRKFGFGREATLKKHTKRNGRYYDDYLMVKFLR